MMAIGAMDALQDAASRVPKDVSVIGCDNIFYSGIPQVSLTTIDHFVDLKGRDACDIIIRKIMIQASVSGKASVPQVYIILSIPRNYCAKNHRLCTYG